MSDMKISYRVLRRKIRFLLDLCWKRWIIPLWILLLLLWHGRTIAHQVLSIHRRCRSFHTGWIRVPGHHATHLGVHTWCRLLLLLHVRSVLVLRHVAWVHSFIHHRSLDAVWCHASRLELCLALQRIITIVIEFIYSKMNGVNKFQIA